MNVAAYLIAGLTLVYTVGQVLDFETWKPVIFINLGAHCRHVGGAVPASLS